MHLSKLINIEFNPSNVQKLEEEYGVQISEHWKNYALNVINNFAGEVLDVDAVTGGFNLQVAWSSAYAAAMHLNN